MTNSGLASIHPPVDLVDVSLFQALPSNMTGVNVPYKGYNEFVLYGQNLNGTDLGLKNSSPFYYLYVGMTWDDGLEHVIQNDGDGKGLFFRNYNDFTLEGFWC